MSARGLRPSKTKRRRDREAKSTQRLPQQRVLVTCDVTTVRMCVCMYVCVSCVCVCVCTMCVRGAQVDSAEGIRLRRLWAALVLLDVVNEDSTESIAIKFQIDKSVALVCGGKDTYTHLAP